MFGVFSTLTNRMKHINNYTVAVIITKMKLIFIEMLNYSVQA